MKRIALLAAFLLIASPSFGEEFLTRPNRSLTPGVTRDLTLTKICNTKWGTDQRSVTAKMKQNVEAAYMFDVATCPLTKLKGKRVRRVEIDHLVPRALGGADVEQNLWPQCYEQTQTDKSKQDNGAHKKDRLETELNKRVCKKPRSLARLKEYQDKFKSDWIALYREIYPDE